MLAQTERIIYWLSKLVQIPSVSSIQAGPKAGQPGEQAMAEFLAATFRSLGADEVELEELLPGRPNVYAIWHGTTNRWAALDVHTDTVSVEQMTDPPFDGRLQDNKIWGRGAVDTKASLALVIATLEAMQQAGQKPVPNLVVVGTINEESGGDGARGFANWVRRRGLALDELMVAEPTRCAPIYGHKGAMGLEIEVQGVPAHTSQPHLGKNAIYAAAHLIVALEAEHERLQTLDWPTPLGAPTLTVSLISGGVGRNVVPDKCTLSLGRRMVPFEDPQAEADKLIALAEAACPLPFTINYRIGIEAFYQSPNLPWIEQLAEWSGGTPTVAPYDTNALAYGGLAQQTIIFGPGSIDQAHGVVEWIEVAELEKAAQVYAYWLGAA